MNAGAPYLNEVEAFRRQFTALNHKCYLNFGGQGVLARSTLEKIIQTYEFVQEKGPFSTSMFTWLLKEQLSTRQCLSTHFGGSAESYALVQNATEGCNIVMWGLPWRPGDHILLSDGEHVGVVHAAMQLQKRQSLELDFCSLSHVSSTDEMLDLISKALRRNTKLFVYSHVLWNTGRRLPVRRISELCRSRGVLCLVDGAQSAGAIDINVAADDCDFYAFTGHKWLCGPEGTGALYVAPHALERLEPVFVGWRGSAIDRLTGEPTGFTAGASKFEVGTFAVPLFAGLRHALALHDEFASSKEREVLLIEKAAEMMRKLERIPGVECLLAEPESGLVSFTVSGASPPELVAGLERQAVLIRSIPTPDCLRASVHFFSNESEMEQCAHSVGRICQPG